MFVQVLFEKAETGFDGGIQDLQVTLEAAAAPLQFAVGFEGPGASFPLREAHEVRVFLQSLHVGRVEIKGEAVRFLALVGERHLPG